VIWRRYRADVAAVALLWGLCLLFLWRLFSPVPALRLHVLQGDFTNQFYPFRYFAAAEWRAGRIPLWNPYVFAGHPFLADIQTAVFYPLSLANALLGALFGLPLAALELEMAAHYPLAALFTYLLGRRLLGSRLGALVAAAVFTFSGFLTSYPAQQLAMLESAVWLPLVVLLLDLGATRPASGYRWHVAAGLALAVCILAGHPQTAMLVAYTSLAYLVYRTVTLTPDPSPALRERGAEGGVRVALRAFVGAAIFLAVGLGVAAVQVLPAAEFVGLSTRASMPYEAAAYGYDRRALLGILLPWWRGEKALYVGILPLLLGAFAVARAVLPARRWGEALTPDPSPAERAPASTSRPAAAPPPLSSPPAGAYGGGICEGAGICERGAEGGVRADRAFPTPFFAALALLAVVLSVGGKTPLFRLFYLLVPGFTLFRDQERIIYLFAFAASLLAGSGASYFARLNAGKAIRLRPLGIGVSVALGSSAALALALLYLGRRAPATFDPSGTLAPGLAFYLTATCASAAVLYLRRRTDRVRLFGALVLGVVVADLFAVNLGNNLSAANPDPGPRLAPVVAALRPTPEDFRVRAESDDVFPPNYAAVWGLPTIGGDTPFALQRVSDLLYAENAEWRRWQVLNVKYFLSRKPPFEGVEPLLESGNIKVYRVVYSLPRAWAVRDVQVAAGPADALARVLAPAYHPGDTAVLEEPPSLGPFVKGERPDVRIVSYSPQRVELTARGDGNAILVLADTYYPGWRAFLDSAPTKLYRANYVVRAIELPPGEHRVEFVFDPTSFKVGAVVSALALVASIGCLLAPRLAAAHGSAEPPA